MTIFSEADIRSIADLVEQKVLEGQEVVRQEFYGAIQQLINNQQALAEMVAMRQGQSEVATMLAHEFWQRSILSEAQRIQVELDAKWEEMKPYEETVQPDLPFDFPPPSAPRPKQCPDCQSRDANAVYRLANGEFCRNPWHDFVPYDI